MPSPAVLGLYLHNNATPFEPDIMQLTTILISLCGIAVACVVRRQQDVSASRAPPSYLIHQYPNGTWIENLAIRSNGLILATDASSPHLYSVDPFTGATSLVHRFPDATGAMGIAETIPDVFYIVLGNFSLASLQGRIGTFSLWQIDFSNRGSLTPKISKHLDLPTVMFLDGLITLDPIQGLLLGADLNKGKVVRINVQKKTSTVVINDPLLRPGTNSTLGVDGIKIRDSILYFTTPGQNVLGKIPIDALGRPTATASVIQPLVHGDDFIFDREGNIFATGGSNELTEIDGTQLERMRDLAPFGGPTAAQFGRTPKDSGCLYVTTCGGFPAYRAGPPILVGGAIYAVDVFKNGSCPTAKRS